MKLPGCDSVLCDWEEMKTYYRDVVYPRHQLSSCDMADFERACGGIAACPAKGTPSLVD